MRTSVDASGSIRLLSSSNLNFFDDGPTLDLLAATMLHQVIRATVTSVVAEVKPSAWSFRITEFFQQKYFILVFLAYYLLVTLLHLPHLLHIHCKHPAITDELTITSLSPRDEELWVTIFDGSVTPPWIVTHSCGADTSQTSFHQPCVFLVTIMNTIACNTVISVLLDSPLYTLCTRPLHNPAAT